MSKVHATENPFMKTYCDRYMIPESKMMDFESLERSLLGFTQVYEVMGEYIKNMAGSLGMLYNHYALHVQGQEKQGAFKRQEGGGQGSAKQGHKVSVNGSSASFFGTVPVNSAVNNSENKPQGSQLTQGTFETQQNASDLRGTGANNKPETTFDFRDIISIDLKSILCQDELKNDVILNVGTGAKGIGNFECANNSETENQGDKDANRLFEGVGLKEERAGLQSPSELRWSKGMGGSPMREVGIKNESPENMNQEDENRKNMSEILSQKNKMAVLLQKESFGKGNVREGQKSMGLNTKKETGKINENYLQESVSIKQEEVRKSSQGIQKRIENNENVSKVRESHRTSLHRGQSPSSKSSSPLTNSQMIEEFGHVRPEIKRISKENPSGRPISQKFTCKETKSILVARSSEAAGIEISELNFSRSSEKNSNYFENGSKNQNFSFNPESLFHENAIGFSEISRNEDSMIEESGDMDHLETSISKVAPWKKNFSVGKRVKVTPSVLSGANSQHHFIENPSVYRYSQNSQKQFPMVAVGGEGAEIQKDKNFYLEFPKVIKKQTPDPM